MICLWIVCHTAVLLCSARPEPKSVFLNKIKSGAKRVNQSWKFGLITADGGLITFFPGLSNTLLHLWWEIKSIKWRNRVVGGLSVIISLSESHKCVSHERMQNNLTHSSDRYTSKLSLSWGSEARGNHSLDCGIWLLAKWLRSPQSGGSVITATDLPAPWLLFISHFFYFQNVYGAWFWDYNYVVLS